jgi:hypothetical protein
MSIDENELCKKILNEMVDAFTEALYGEWLTYHPREIGSRRRYCPPAPIPSLANLKPINDDQKSGIDIVRRALVTLAEQCRR